MNRQPEAGIGTARKQAVDAFSATLLASATYGFDLPDARLIVMVLKPSAVASTIFARQTTLIDVLRSEPQAELCPQGPPDAQNIPPLRRSIRCAR